MEWTEITIEVSPEQVDMAGDIAQMVVPYGIYIEDYTGLEEQVEQIAHIDLIDEQLLAKDRSRALVHIYISPDENPAEAIAFLSERYSSEGIAHKITTSGCEEQDWLNNWRQYFNPIEVGRKLLIRPTWRDNYDPAGRVVLSIDPGLAFGTGGHETTRLCLEAIEKYITPDCEMLDVGCGSGILSVASLLLGASSAFGVDIDAAAVRTARENAEINKVSQRFRAVCGSLTDKVSGRFDLVAANIVADAVIALSAQIPQFLKPDGIYIMSGIIDTRRQEVIDALTDEFDIIEINENNGWVCIAARLKT